MRKSDKRQRKSRSTERMDSSTGGEGDEKTSGRIEILKRCYTCGKISD